MDTRLERIIMSLVKQYAPQLFGGTGSLGTTREERLARVSRRLARYGILLLACETATEPDHMLTQVQNWASASTRLYATLTRALFPSFAGINTRVIDGDVPPVLISECECTPVAQVMAGFILPYLSSRYLQPVSEAELRGLMDIVLEELEAIDLPRTDYNALRAEGISILQKMLTMPVYQIALTTFDRPIFFGDTTASMPRSTGELPAVRSTGTQPNLQPDKLPEQDKLRTGEKPKTSTQSLPAATIVPPSAGLPPPNPARPRAGTGPLRRPPVPDLPDDKK